jgi:UDP-N-acetylmuramoyl-L-alanyl-D-glutamate--2,6-diaminopimelate ligase
LKKLIDILSSTSYQLIAGSTDTEINQLQFDSRKVTEKDVFVAIKGTQVDGHHYIDKAIRQKASVVVVEDVPEKLADGLCYIQVANSAKALAQMADAYYGHPSQKLKLVGVTGTNGKTTIATLLYQLFRHLGYSCGLLSTIRILIDDQEIQATHTTPDSIQLNKMFRQMLDSGCEYCFMEVSSHAIDQYRIEALNFDAGIFTNLTHDHLDYHKTFDNYLKTKKKFFDTLPKTAFALVNKDDKNGLVMIQNTQANKQTYAIKNQADYKSKIIENDLSGLHLQLGNKDFYSNKVGLFNAYNVTAVYASAMLLGLNEDEVLSILSLPNTVEGRFELIYKHPAFKAILDYAHTPDALQNVLTTIKGAKKKSERLITVFGCGGNRDKSKRPEMGKIASTHSDLIVITSDNPRNEDPMQIIKDIEAGIADEQAAKCISITDRENAIKTACMMANEGDILLVAGKGHEKYQEINGVKHHFDDKEVLLKYLKEI